MSFFTSYVSAKVRDLHDVTIRTVAKWDPESVGEAQLAEWDSTAKEMTAGAAKAATDAKAATNSFNNIRNKVEGYPPAATKLAATNEEAANKAADQALEWQGKLESAESEATDANAWAGETLEAAQ